jgi:hypothetical protein
MKNTDHALIVCQQIQRLGKTPSVALIRQYASKPLTIPEIIKALQRWKNNPQAIIEEVVESEPNKVLGLEERVLILENKVAELTSKLESLLEP